MIKPLYEYVETTIELNPVTGIPEEVHHVLCGSKQYTARMHQKLPRYDVRIHFETRGPSGVRSLDHDGNTWNGVMKVIPKDKLKEIPKCNRKTSLMNGYKRTSI